MALNLKLKDNPVKFGGHLGGRTLLVVLLVVSLILFVAYAREGNDGPLHSLQNTTSGMVTPLTAVGTTVGSLAVSGTMSVEDLTAGDAAYNQLKENNARLSQMVVELEEYRQEAARLEAIIGLADAYGFTSVAARVVGYSTDSYNRSITLDAGSAAGIKTGMPVMGATGVIGQVVSTTPATCNVRLLTDPQSGVSVLIQSSRAEGILRGSVEGTLYLEGIEDTVEVKEGDVVITSGLGGGYYRGLVVGMITKIEQRPGSLSRTIVVTPNASFNNISEALVVIAMGDANAADNEALARLVNSQTLSDRTSGSGDQGSEGSGEGGEE
ncbi:rod shape-determining protein MreC [Anaerotardibacter muris]|uniref:rod shape-determining protein MreC n=1 Tax=Anaerotardibacter muris TaxID=2941505 RepID=UPI00203ED0FE|nr:rod shape-determining protein MreC [Anaerotardibacter muris]